MNFKAGKGCDQSELLHAYALRALPRQAVAAMEAHLGTCAECRREMDAMRPVVDSLGAWPTDVLRPSASLWQRIATRIGAPAGPEPLASPAPRLEWEEVAPGISCKLLATDADRRRVSMLVRLQPGTEYPPHTHAGIEELHLLLGELWINDRKLVPGDYSLAQPQTADVRVWSETGCTCVLITSPDDRLAA